jgi:hypothetical protein
MSTHNLPANIDMDLARYLLVKYLREPSGIIYGNGLQSPPTAVEFTPDLSAQELTTLSEIAQRYQDAKADYDQYETFRTQLKAYLNLASPTNAQTLAAVKATVRIVLFMMDTLVRRTL